MLNDGTMVTGWLKIDRGNDVDYYYMRGDGTMATGWREMDGGLVLFPEQRQVRGERLGTD